MGLGTEVSPDNDDGYLYVYSSVKSTELAGTRVIRYLGIGATLLFVGTWVNVEEEVVQP